MKLIIDIDKKYYEACKDAVEEFCPSQVEEIIANGIPITEGDMISREGIRKALNEAFDCEDATKYGNKNAEQQGKSYSTLMLYEIADIVEDCCDNAPTVAERPKGKGLYPYADIKINGRRVGKSDKECSVCHVGFSNNLPWNANFCPYCGADMRGGAE